MYGVDGFRLRSSLLTNPIMLNLMSIQIQIHRTTNLRRNPPSKNMNQTNSPSQFHKATKIQNPITTTNILRRTFHGNIHPLTPFSPSSPTPSTSLPEDHSTIHKTDGAVVEIERTEVGIIDGEFSVEGEIKRIRRRGISVVREGDSRV